MDDARELVNTLLDFQPGEVWEMWDYAAHGCLFRAEVTTPGTVWLRVYRRRTRPAGAAVDVLDKGRLPLDSYRNAFTIGIQQQRFFNDEKGEWDRRPVGWAKVRNADGSPTDHPPYTV
jgi:hypothetical protein